MRFQFFLFLLLHLLLLVELRDLFNDLLRWIDALASSLSFHFSSSLLGSLHLAFANSSFALGASQAISQLLLARKGNRAIHPKDIKNFSTSIQSGLTAPPLPLLPASSSLSSSAVDSTAHSESSPDSPNDTEEEGDDNSNNNPSERATPPAYETPSSSPLPVAEPFSTAPLADLLQPLADWTVPSLVMKRQADEVSAAEVIAYLTEEERAALHLQADPIVPVDPGRQLFATYNGTATFGLLRQEILSLAEVCGQCVLWFITSCR